MKGTALVSSVAVAARNKGTLLHAGVRFAGSAAFFRSVPFVVRALLMVVSRDKVIALPRLLARDIPLDTRTPYVNVSPREPCLIYG